MVLIKGKITWQFLATGKDPYAKWHKAENNLETLKKFQQCCDTCSTTELWEKYRLLPTTPMYLVASRYTKGQISWHFHTKWKLFKIFDNVFKSENLPQIRVAIDKGIVDLNNIASLRKLYALLTDDSKSLEEKVAAYDKLAKTNESLFNQIRHNICSAREKNPHEEKEFATQQIKNCPDSDFHKEIVKSLINRLKNGYDFYS